MVVVFPAPLGPKRPSTSPAWTSKVTSAMACLRPNRRLTSTTWTPAVTGCGASGAVVRGRYARPLGVGVARRDRRQGRERLRRVLPLHDREAVVRRTGDVLRFVVERPREPVECVVVEVVQPVHEPFSGQVGAHGLGRLLELVAHGPTLGGPLVQEPPRLVLVEVAPEASDDRVARVAVGVGGPHAVDEVAAWRAEVGADLLAPCFDGGDLGLQGHVVARGHLAAVHGLAQLLVRPHVHGVPDALHALLLHVDDVGVERRRCEVLTAVGTAALVVDAHAFGLEVSLVGVALLLGDGDVEEEHGRLGDAAVLLEPPVLPRGLPPLSLVTDLLAVPHGTVVAVEVEHRRILLVPVVQREAEVGDALAEVEVRRPAARLRVVGQVGEDLVLVDELLGAGQVAVAGALVVAGVDDELATVDAALGIHARGERLQPVERGAEGVGAELALDGGDVADLDRGRGHAHVAGGVGPAGASAAAAGGRTTRAAARAACRPSRAGGRAALGAGLAVVAAGHAALVGAPAAVAGRDVAAVLALLGVHERAVGQPRPA